MTLISDWMDREDSILAPYAMRSRLSRGRRYAEEPHPYRNAFQRDRERIVHSTAFRRLMHKTQVIVAQTNDHHRTRLTHTLEVAQISRTISRRLGLNEDLTEAIALSHDECLGEVGGFDHNLHALRLVEWLEERYPNFPGLNLSWEVREAFVHHSKRHRAPEAGEFRDNGSPLLEAQVVDAADSLTYNTHDIDDAIGLELISLDDLMSVELWRRAAEQVRRADLTPDIYRTGTVRLLIDWQVRDLLDHTAGQLERHAIRSVADVRAFTGSLVGCGPAMASLIAELEDFLRRRVYCHWRVMRMAHKGKRMLRELFAELCRAPDQLPERFMKRRSGEPIARIVGDYLAGMTDRFAQLEYLRLFHPLSDV
jgi:dGTPase